MNTYVKLAIAAAAVLALAVVGFNLLPAGGGAPVGAPVPSPAPTPSPSQVQSQAPAATAWSPGPIEAGRRYTVTSHEVPFSFAGPTGSWFVKGEDALETGTFPTGSYAWVVFTGDIGVVGTDPCAGQAAPVEGDSIDDLATALTTIPGTTAAEPVDATVGGLPEKLVVLTIDADPPCPMNEFWLYGDISLYPNTVDSTLRLWIIEVANQRWVIHTDQAGPNPEVEQQIQQVVDSIQFE